MLIICPHCNAELDAGEELFGCDVVCPGCQRQFMIPMPEPESHPALFESEPVPPTNPKNNSNNLISCPDCGGKVSKAAAACPHCGRPLQAANSPSLPQAAPAKKDFGFFLLLIPLFGTGLLWAWIPHLSLLDDPSTKIIMISAAVVLGTSLLAYFESSAAVASAPDKKLYPAGNWLVIMILMWIIGYPGYLFERHKYGLRNYCFLGFIIAVLFAGVSSYFLYAIENHRGNIQANIEKIYKDFSR